MTGSRYVAGNCRRLPSHVFNYEFADAAGGVQHVTETIDVGPPSPAVGETVQVEYLPAFGNAARRQDHAPAVTLIRISFAISLIAAVAIFHYVRREKPRWPGIV